jgi:hypothetical protein
VGLTVFADLSNEEYRNIYLGTHVVVRDIVTKIVIPEVHHPAMDVLDWTMKGAVTRMLLSLYHLLCKHSEERQRDKHMKQCRNERVVNEMINHLIIHQRLSSITNERSIWD